MNATSEEPFERRLVAVAFADVAGYSRLMGLNDEKTVRNWRSLKADVIEPLIRECGGRLIDDAGDGLLIEFPSAIHALRWAGDVQHASNEVKRQGDRFALDLRIGVNVDDAILENDNVRGEGINIAARIHQSADPGQVVVTGIVRELVGNRLPVTFHDLGTPKLKNIDRMVQVYAVDWARNGSPDTLQYPYQKWSSHPALAVMPFASIGGTETGDYFAHGITEDIITGLSRSRSLHVIARASMWRYADRQKDVEQVASELGVGYVLDGSVRRGAGRLRINAELINISQNRVIWAERFDGSEDDLFGFQDNITASILGSLEPRLNDAEIERVRQKPPTRLDAYENVLKASSELYNFTDESFRASGEALETALEQDPLYAQAHAYYAWRLNFLLGEERSNDPEGDTELALEHSQKAILLDPEDSFALAVAGHLTSFMQQKPYEAIQLFDTALKLNQNSAFAWALSADTLSYCGEPDEAMKRFRNVWKLNPFDRHNFFWWSGAGIAEFVAGRYGEASAWLQKAGRANPNFAATFRMLSASLAMAGDVEAAQVACHRLLSIDPDFSVSRFIEWYPLQREEDLKRLELGLLKAGLPK